MRCCAKCGQFENRYPELCYPTLSELIDACGDEFDALAHRETTEGGEWVALSFHSHRHARSAEPEEAVAHLWLALYANKHRRRYGLKDLRGDTTH
jgi:hypothetical protein